MCVFTGLLYMFKLFICQVSCITLKHTITKTLLQRLVIKRSAICLWYMQLTKPTVFTRTCVKTIGQNYELYTKFRVDKLGRRNQNDVNTDNSVSPYF